MSGVYFHIPFCKQACHYCDFHFSTNMSRKKEMVSAMIREVEMRKEFFRGQVDTIYFGGGTPSLLAFSELNELIQVINHNFDVVKNPEITLEVNPDDVTPDSANDWKSAGINRLSLGVQSFFENDLKMMNRVHNAAMAKESIKILKDRFENFSIDLIYGLPGSNTERWSTNLELALEFDIVHLSAYALTVEPKTALKNYIEKGIIQELEEEEVALQFEILVATMQKGGYDHYEISNFGRSGYYSRNNVAYWQGKPYLGVGPSAHSFDGKNRSWNVRNNRNYLRAIEQNKLSGETEELTDRDRYNEMVMTGLRTMWGVSLNEMENRIGPHYRKFVLEQAAHHIDDGLIRQEGQTLYLTGKGKFLADGIASDLFMINLK